MIDVSTVMLLARQAYMVIYVLNNSWEVETLDQPGRAVIFSQLANEQHESFDQAAKRFLRRQAAGKIDPSVIVIKGASQHNLKHIDLAIPRNKLIVLTGVSGSGKSSLAFDTIYAEGQRRYIQSLSTYARLYVEQMEKPKVEYIVGLSPVIAIEQKAISHNPRSTVGTITEITDYLRLLYSRIGIPHCVHCGTALTLSMSACPNCSRPFTPLRAAHFSPNTADGMCPACNGLGTKLEVDPALVVDQPHLSLLDGATRWYGDLRKKSKSKYALASLRSLA